MPKTTVAVTGATGFVGRVLIDQLTAEGIEVRAWWHSRKGPDRPGVTWLPGKLDDPAATARLVEGADAVVHAALSRDETSFLAPPTDPPGYYQTNVLGSMRLIDAAAGAGAERFVFVSSGAVHATVLPDRPLDETHPLLPNTLYGACKAAVESLLPAYAATSDMTIAAVRPVAIYGVEDPLAGSRWYDLVRAVAAGKDVDGSGGGKVVHHHDVAAAIKLLLQTDKPINGKTFNCCDAFISTRHVAEIAKELSGQDVRISGEAKTSQHEMRTDRLRDLGFHFGGEQKLRETIGQLM